MDKINVPLLKKIDNSICRAEKKLEALRNTDGRKELELAGNLLDISQLYEQIELMKKFRDELVGAIRKIKHKLCARSDPKECKRHCASCKIIYDEIGGVE